MGKRDASSQIPPGTASGKRPPQEGSGSLPAYPANYSAIPRIAPPLIFLGVGAITDFGPMIANPKLVLLGAGAHLGIFVALIIA